MSYTFQIVNQRPPIVSPFCFGFFFIHLQVIPTCLLHLQDVSFLTFLFFIPSSKTSSSILFTLYSSIFSWSGHLWSRIIKTTYSLAYRIKTDNAEIICFRLLMSLLTHRFYYCCVVYWFKIFLFIYLFIYLSFFGIYIFFMAVSLVMRISILNLDFLTVGQSKDKY